MLMLLDGYSLLVGRVVTCGMTKDLFEYGVDDLLSPEEIEEVLRLKKNGMNLTAGRSEGDS